MDYRTHAEGAAGIIRTVADIRRTVAAARDESGEVDLARVDVAAIERHRAELHVGIQWVEGAYE